MDISTTGKNTIDMEKTIHSICWIYHLSTKIGVFPNYFHVVDYNRQRT